MILDAVKPVKHRAILTACYVADLRCSKPLFEIRIVDAGSWRGLMGSRCRSVRGPNPRPATSAPPSALPTDGRTGRMGDTILVALICSAARDRRVEGDKMPAFDHLMVLPGIVAALSLGRLLSGFALSLERSRVTWYPLHLAWAAILFVLQILSWHVSLACRESNIGQSLLNYLAFFTFPATVYLASTVLMPRDVPAGESLDFQTYYYDRAARFFTICTIGLLLTIGTNTVFPCGRTPGLLGENGYRIVGAICTATLAWFSRGGHDARECMAS